jgi:hypothetical protein
MERRLALWFNSTLGLFSMLMQRQETRGAWVKFPKAWYNELHVLDLRCLNESQTLALDGLWAQVSNRDLLPFPNICSDEARKTIDNVLSKEPIISMQPL